MSNHGDYKDQLEYLNAKMKNRDVNVIMVQAPVPGQNPGEFGLMEMGPKGKFLHAFEGGIFVRVDDSEDFFEWDDIKRLRFISGIHTQAPPGILAQ